MSTDIELLRSENTILWKKLADLEEAYRIREFDYRRLMEERDKYKEALTAIATMDCLRTWRKSTFQVAKEALGMK